MMKVVRVIVVMLAFAFSAGAEEARGFDPGQTLPDIALTDLEGNEVRFSDFLGKQYVLFGWASW